MPTELTPENMVARLVAALEQEYEPQGGRIHFAQDPLHPLELLAQSPKGWQVIVHWAGDEAFGDQETQPMASQRIELTVSYNPGLTAEPNEKVYTSSDSRPSLLNYVQRVRSFALSRSWEAESTGQYPMYRGTRPVVLPDGTRLRAYTITLALDAALYFNAYTPIGEL